MSAMFTGIGKAHPCVITVNAEDESEDVKQSHAGMAGGR